MVAPYNALQVARYENALRKMLGVKNGAVMPTLAPELGAEINVQPMMGEMQALVGWTPFSLVRTVAAGGAGNYSGILVYPPDANQVIEITRIASGATASSSTDFGLTTTATTGLLVFTVPGGNLVAFSRDGRVGPNNGLVVGTYGHMNAAGVSAHLLRVQSPASPATQFVTTDFILQNDARANNIAQLLILNQTANQAVTFQVEGRVRSVEVGETWP